MLPARCVYDTISQPARRAIYRDGDTGAGLLDDQSVKTDFCTSVKYKTYCIRWNLFRYGLDHTDILHSITPK